MNKLLALSLILAAVGLGRSFPHPAEVVQTPAQVECGIWRRGLDNLYDLRDHASFTPREWMDFRQKERAIKAEIRRVCHE